MQKQYNYCLDFVKGIACIFVVLMHCEFPGTLGTVVQAVSRFCVPLFFMVSGYFCFKPESGIIRNEYCARITRKVKHVLIITLGACAFYTVFMLVRTLLGGQFNWTISRGNLAFWLIFNRPAWAGVAGQYWFLFALLYVYIFYWILMRIGVKYKYLYCFAGAMFILYIFLAQGMHLLGMSVPNMMYRNWLVEGFPYFMLGHWIHNHQEKLNISNKILVAIVAVSTMLCLVERYLLGRDFGVNISTIPQVFCMFLLAVNNPNSHKGIIQETGKNLSMFVYIIHPAVWHAMQDVYKGIGINDNPYALYAMPVIVVILTMILSFVVFSVNLRFKLIFQKNEVSVNSAA